MDDKDIRLLRAAFGVAQNARENGNHPFGALLVDEEGHIISRAENTVVTENDCTGHAEINLMREVSAKYDGDFLAKCTIYTSTEPCPMCAGAIFWSNVRRVVYGLSEESLSEMVVGESEEIINLSCREIFERGRRSIEVIGPLLEQEAREVHIGFWDLDSENEIS